jgi:hypothetical protein
MMNRMKADTYRKIALLHEITKQNRMIELRLKMQKTLHPQMKAQFKKMIENLQKN